MLFIASATGYSASSVSTLDTSATLNIAAGDVLVAYFAGPLYGPYTVTSINETGGASNDLTLLASSNPGGEVVQAGYKITAAASATATFRLTLSNSIASIEFKVLQFRPEAGETASFGGGPAAAESGFGDNPTSATLSTTSANSMFVGAAYNDRTALSSPLLGGATPDGTLSGTLFFSIGYTEFATAQTSITYATTSDFGIWGAEMIVIDITISAGGGIVVLRRRIDN